MALEPIDEELLPSGEYIERDGNVIRFKGLYDSTRPGESVEMLDHSEPFEQSNAAGELRQLDSLEEAFAEGQRIALDMRRIELGN